VGVDLKGAEFTGNKQTYLHTDTQLYIVVQMLVIVGLCVAVLYSKYYVIKYKYKYKRCKYQYQYKVQVPSTTTLVCCANVCSDCVNEFAAVVGDV